jgi:phage-related baseplate assembly protein
MAEVPVFIENDPIQIISEMKSFYESDTGKVLPLGSPEMRIINMFATRESNLRSSVNSASLQMLVEFSSAPILDSLAALVGVVRLTPAYSLTTIQFVFPITHGPIVLPANIRIQSTDGKAVFQLNEDLVVGLDVETITATATCSIAGAIGNDYDIGDISIILDPQPFLISASNTTVTNSGSDQETDEQLRERIKLAPSSFSVAGPEDAYIFFAKSANPLIIDVAVPNPPDVPGTVKVYPLISGGVVTPTEILTQVYDKLSSEKVRPLCDTVLVIAPTKISFDLVVEITKISSAVSQDIIDYVTPRLEAYLQNVSMKMGRDVVVTQIQKIVSYDDSQVYDVVLTDGVNPFANIIVSDIEYAYCNSLTINIVGSNVG